MLKLKISNESGAEIAGKHVDVNNDVFARKFNADLVHQTVCAYLAAKRSGTSAQKSRSEVRGGGTKPWKQKGTGHARAGTIRSPIWRGGGVTFAAKTRDYSQKINRKMYRGAMCCILSELVKSDRLMVIENFEFSSQKTRDLNKKLETLKLDNVLIVTDNINPGLCLAARNLPKVDVCIPKEVNPVDLIGFEKILFTVPALRSLEERLVCKI